MNVFLDALADAWGQMTGTLNAVLIYVVAASVAVLVLAMRGVSVGSRVGYRRGRFLTANEKSFLRTLDVALGRNYRAFAQVRLAELADPASRLGGALRRRALSGVMAKSVDFVICDVLTLDPVAAVEVDDPTHLLPERRARDAFVNAVFAEIGLPLLRVKAERRYSVPELRGLLARADLIPASQSRGASL